MRRKTTVAITAFTVALLGATGASADTIHVPGDHATIQGAIGAAGEGDEIVVAPDTYTEAIDLLGKTVHLRSSAGAETTIIDATGLGASVVTCASGEEPATILEGFTVSGGTGTLIAAANRIRGGGMYIDGAAPTILRCLFTGNVANEGGGMFIAGGSDPLIRACRFAGNTAHRDLMDGSGGGIMIDVGAGATVIECAFIGNDAEYGGALRAWQAGHYTLVNCLFQDNTVDGSPGGFGGYGGAVHHSHSTGLFVNCAFVGNASVNSGGAIIAGEYLLELANCTFAGNTVQHDGPPIGGGALHAWGGGEVVLTNCILWGDAAPLGPEIYLRTMATNFATVNVSYSDVEGGAAGVEVEPGSTLVWGDGNIEDDPVFVNAPGGDCRLAMGSPASDAGHNWGVPVDSFDLDDDGLTGELTPYDLDGLPRFNADELDFDPGCGTPAVVDMGAYEYQFDPVGEVLFADLDGTGTVDVDDLLILLGAWGECSTACCMADLDRSGFVDVDDLLAVLGSWG